MKNNTYLLNMALAASCLALASTSYGATLLSTDFDSTTVSSTTLSGITYTTSSGLSGPSSITASANLFDTTDTTGHFAPNVQINNGQWTASFDMTVGGSDLTIDDVTLERQHFNVSGQFNTASEERTYPITVALTGSSSGSLGSVTIDPSPDWGSNFSTETFSFGGVTAVAGETLTMDWTVGDNTSAGSGVFVGFDNYSVNGSVVPEPTAIALIALSGFALMLRRR